MVDRSFAPFALTPATNSMAGTVPEEGYGRAKEFPSLYVLCVRVLNFLKHNASFQQKMNLARYAGLFVKEALIPQQLHDSIDYNS
jgi:hypothetical protein